jgi:tetratricopeptide (TPR) repeat protein
LRYYQEALTLVRATDDPYAEAGILAGLGDAHQALGRYDEASAAWRTAFGLCQVQHRTHDAEELRSSCGGRSLP